ncbi:MAG: helix-turn-helix transcriptional regulator [Lachnospiraceae bacterium]|nr:helix-turn-helix transcriptional regulator [Lachnospiraceae bacterium]
MFFCYTDGKEDGNRNRETTGKFIAACRKENRVTQQRLKKKLNTANRPASKWETKKSIPDAAIMLGLCKILGISVNERLGGKRVAIENNQKTEKSTSVEMPFLTESI